MKNVIFKIALICSLSLYFPLNSVGQMLSICDNRQYKDDDKSIFASPSYNDGDWQFTDIPHTLNDKDLIDDRKGYRRSVGCYRKIPDIPQINRPQRVALRFEGEAVKPVFILTGSF